MKLVTASLVGLLTAMPLAAQTPEAGQGAREHVVRQGDTLWDLAGHYFANPYGWRTIYEANLGVVEDPHWIYPDEVIIIPGLFDPNDPTPPRATVAVRPMDRPLRTVFYRGPVAEPSREGPTVLIEEERPDLPVRPGEFQSAEFVADPGELPVLGRMIRPVRDVEIMGHQTRSTAHPKDAVFLGYAGAERPGVGTRVLLVRPGERVRELGRSARVMHPSAVLTILGHHEDVMEARVDVQFGPVLLNQLAIPLPMFPDFLVERAEPVEGDELAGRIVGFVQEQPLYGRGERGFIDLGTSHGVQVGDVFIAYLPERRARVRNPGEFRGSAEELPPEAVAELRIVRVMGDHATFLVDGVRLPVLEDGIGVQRIRKMP